MIRLRLALSVLLLLLLPALPAQAQSLPPSIEGYRFFAFLDVTTETEELLPTLIRRELPELPQAWYDVERYITTYYPQVFTAPRSRILKAGSAIRLPLYRRPSELSVLPVPPPAPPTPAPAARPQEAIIGALIDADDLVQVVGSLGQQRLLLAVDNVRRGDTITTDAKTNASLRLLDGTTILLRADSSLLLKEFRFAKGDSNTGVLNLKLLKGAMRTISGMIPKDPNSQYALETPKATLTVRGTDYAVRICEAEDRCQIDGEAAPAGLYAGVLEGGIDLGNGGGSSPAEAGDIVRVDTPEAAAAAAPEAAPLVFTAEELKLLPRKQRCQRSVGGGDGFACR